MKKNKLSVVLGTIVFLSGCWAAIGSLYMIYDEWVIFIKHMDFVWIFTSLLIVGIVCIVYTIQTKFWMSKTQERIWAEMMVLKEENKALELKIEQKELMGKLKA